MRRFFLIALLSGGFFSYAADPASRLQSEGRLLISPDSRAFVGALQPAQVFTKVEKDQLAKQMDSLAANLRSPIIWETYLTAKPSVFMSFPGASEHFDARERYPIVLGTIQSPSNSLTGFFAVTLLTTKTADREAVVEYIISPNGNGAAEALLLFLKDGFSKALNVKKLYAELEWAGREFWSQPQFGFELSALQPSVRIHGRDSSFAELIQFNFSNFLKEHSLSTSDLRIVRDGKIADFDREQIVSPGYLRLVQRKDGQKVSVTVLKSFELVQQRLLHVGPAFMLADHTVKNGTSPVTVGGQPKSLSALPSWFGVIHNRCADIL